MGELKQTRGAQQDCQERFIYFVESMAFHLHLSKICGQVTVRVATVDDGKKTTPQLFNDMQERSVRVGFTFEQEVSGDHRIPEFNSILKS
jgi:hypothetical protein